MVSKNNKGDGGLHTNRHLHIFRNTPFGKETLLHSIYFCRQLGLDLHLYIPETKKFMMYFANATLEVDLDASYLKYPDTARQHAEAVLAEMDCKADFLNSAGFTASNLPDLPTDIEFMTCPRVISDLTARGGLSIGAKVRNLLHQAPFPVLIPAQAFKEWHHVAVLFGGSKNGLTALRLGMSIAKTSGLPLEIFTQAEQGRRRADYEAIITGAGLDAELQNVLDQWHFYTAGDFIDNLFTLPHDALIVMGIFGHGLVKDMFFGTTAETVQSSMANSLLLAGPKLSPNHWHRLTT